jgi:riboflavin kinase/FMN adenylyltransferase
MKIPDGFELDFGIYAAWVTVSGTRFRGALHWGPIPTFDDTDKSLEVFLLGVGEHELSHADVSQISVEIIKKLRDVVSFSSIEALTDQISRDVVSVRKTLIE